MKILQNPIVVMIGVILATVMYVSLSVYFVESKYDEEWAEAVAVEEHILTAAANEIHHDILESIHLTNMIAEAEAMYEAEYLIKKSEGIFHSRIIAIYDEVGDAQFGIGADFIGKNFAYRRYFQDALNNGRGTEYITGKITGRDGLVTAVRTTFNDKEYVIMAKIPGKILLESFAKFKSETRDIYAIDEYNIIYLHTKEDEEDKLLTFGDKPDFRLKDKIDHRYPDRSIVHINANFKSIDDNYAIVNNKKFIAVSMPFINEGQIKVIADPVQIDRNRVQNYMLLVLIYSFGLFLSMLLIFMSVIRVKAHL